jgi:hypothetical protein
MTSRDELKALLDQLPEPSLDIVKSTVRHLIMQKVAEERFRGKQGSEMGSGGWTGVHNGVHFGGQSFRHFDNGALVERTLQFFDGHEIGRKERLSLSTDRTKLLCTLTLSCGGQTLRHEDEFPASLGEKSRG